MTRVVFAVALLAAVSWCSNYAYAGRVVTFEILVDGQVVLEVQTLDQGEAADTAWNYLKTRPVRNPAEVSVLSPAETERLKVFFTQLDQQGPTKAKLQGKCRIFCRYAGDVTVDELRLVHKDRKSPWFIDPTQVDELAKKRTIDSAMRVREQVDAQGK